MTFSRGNPDSGSEVHLCIPKSEDGTRDRHPACLNGAFNIRMTDDPSQVTCPACSLKAQGMAKAKELGADFDEWVEKKRAGQDWHYYEDFFDDVDDFVRGKMPDAKDDLVIEVTSALVEENKDSYVERGSRYDPGEEECDG